MKVVKEHMPFVPLLAFQGVGLEVFAVAATALVLLTLALLSAAANVLFRSEMHFEDAVREATMDLSPHDRRTFYRLYQSRRPKSAAIAWFLAVGLGPFGVNLYRGRPAACLAAFVSFNGFGAWWIESWFSAPQLVLLENRDLIEWTKERMRLDADRGLLSDTRVLSAPEPPIENKIVSFSER